MGTIVYHIDVQPEEKPMSKHRISSRPPAQALELFQPNPDIYYSLDAAARLADVPRRQILIYCRSGLIRPTFQPPYGVMEFTEKEIFAVRQIERLRTVHGLAMDMIRILFDLLGEVERLRAEVRFLRNA